MANKIFKTEKLEQVKEKTTNMFQQCGGSGTISSPPNTSPYRTRTGETEFRISTLESTYRTPHFATVPRHCVSDSNIFMHRDMDWYREPKLPSYESDINPAPSRLNRDRVETFTTQVRTPGNVLVRFRTFFGMDGSTVEVVTDNSDCVVNTNVKSEENALVRMKNLFAMKGRQYSLGDTTISSGGSRTNDVSKLDKFKMMFQNKSVETNQQVTETVIHPGERIVRMKTFFANRPPGNTVVIESKSSSSAQTKNNFGKIKTLFKTDTGSQTDDIATANGSGSEEQKLNKKAKFKKMLGMDNKKSNEHDKEESLTNIDDRQIFSRQSSLPVRAVEQENRPFWQPIWIDNFVKRVRASYSGARVNDIEIPSAVMMDSHVEKKRKPGRTSGWRWRHGDEIREERRKSNKKSCWRPKRCCTFPVCPFPKLTFASTTLGQAAPDAVELPLTQVIALICGLLVIVLMALGLSSADWLMAAGWRQGLFTHCIEEGADTPLPFNLVEQPGCHASRDVGYIRAAAALCIVTLCADALGSLLTILGLRATDHRTKYKYYRLAVLAMSLALISVLIALVIYPVCFAAELNLGNRTVWEFGWAYGVGWGAAIFLFGAVILLLCDKESEEIYYKERKVERALPPGGA